MTEEITEDVQVVRRITLTTKSSVFVFKDGIYDCATRTFTPYCNDRFVLRQMPVLLSNEETYTCGFSATECKPTELTNTFEDSFPREVLGYKEDDWYSIPTPVFQHILQSQEWPEDTIRMFYAFIGRLFNKHDYLHRTPLLYGPGHGKSTIVNFLYHRILSKKFAILSWRDGMPLVDLPDIERRNNFVIMCVDSEQSSASVYAMLSGGTFASTSIHGSNAYIEVSMHGIAMGNDVRGGVERLFKEFVFSRLITDQDPTLSQRLKQERAAFLHKCNLAYHRCNASRS